MKKTIHICDRCKAEKITEQNEKAGYRTIQLGVSDVDGDRPNFDNYFSNNQKFLTKTYLCERCLEKLGITNENNRPKVEDSKSTSEQIIDLFIELLQERMGE